MTTDPASMSLNDLENELCGLAARLAAATCSFLLAVGEFDRRRGWEIWECHDMAGWLSWKCGISPVTAREQVRVASALDRFSLVRQRFANGQLSYSQVRAIARVATDETEQQLVEMAGFMTAAQLETLARSYRSCSKASDDLGRKRLSHKNLTYSWDDEGCLVGRFRLPPEQGAVLAAAIEAGVSADDVRDAEAEGALNPPGAARAEALVELIAAGASANDTGNDSDTYLVTIVVDDETLGSRGDDSATAPGLCQVADGPGLAAETARRLTCDGPTVNITEDSNGKIIGVGRKSRRPNRPLQRALRHRDRHCQYPGCSRRGHLHGHHIVHWTNGGHTNLDNMTRLCHWHHRRLHEGRYTMRRERDGGLRFFNQYGIEVHAVPTLGPSRPLDSAESQPTGRYHSEWDGSRPDYGLIIDTLLQSDGLLV